MSNLKQNGKLRWAPSYLRRQGQMTRAQKIALRENWESFGIRYQFGEKLDLKTAFTENENPLVLEIGFGMGENLLHLAVKNPDHNFLGIEVHKPGIGAVLKSVAESKIENIRVMRGDARLILEDYIPETTVFDRVLIFFPDPWPNPGEAHRRLFQKDLVDLVGARLKQGGSLHLATDVDEYAEWASQIMSGADGWTPDEIPENWQRVPSKYEAKGIAKGHRIHDLCFARTNASPQA